MKQNVFILLFLLSMSQAEDVYATFTVQADRSAHLAFSSGGIVDEVLVEIGAVVRKGDVLASLQNKDLKAVLEIDKIKEKYSKRDYDRQVKVKSMIDKAKFDTFAFKYANAKVQVKYKQTLLDKTILKAPFDAIVFSKTVEKGDVVSGAMIRTILKVQSIHKRKIILEFDQKYWNLVKVGDVFRYTLDGSDNILEGKISKIYPNVDSITRKIKAEVQAKDIMVGLFGTGTIASRYESVK